MWSRSNLSVSASWNRRVEDVWVLASQWVSASLGPGSNNEVLILTHRQNDVGISWCTIQRPFPWTEGHWPTSWQPPWTENRTTSCPIRVCRESPVPENSLPKEKITVSLQAHTSTNHAICSFPESDQDRQVIFLVTSLNTALCLLPGKCF